MDLSLDEIIQQKKASGLATNGNGPSANGGPRKFISKSNQPMRKTLNRPIYKETPRIADARMKIIQKNRAKIVDARDKLAEITRASGDARQKLLKKKQQSGGGAGVGLRNGGGGGYRSNGSSPRKPVSAPHSRRLDALDFPVRKVVTGISSRNNGHYDRHDDRRLPQVPRGYVDYDNMEQLEQEEYAHVAQLARTVKNDAYDYDDMYAMDTSAAPPPPRRLNSWGSNTDAFDPFDVYEVNHAGRGSASELPPPPPKGILRSSRQLSPSEELYTSSSSRRYLPEVSSHLSYEMRSRLEHAPDPHASMGIFSNPLKNSSSSSSYTQHNPSGYRIVVSNLHTSVTQADIKELFADIGPLYDSRIVRPGVAEVIYKTHMDAEKAVDIYHNRQLDGQPMKCLLVNPRVSDKPTAPAIKSLSSTSRAAAGKTSLEIDIDALHKVLFRRN